MRTETLFFSLLGVQTRELCSVGTKICTMEARMFIDLIQYYFSASWERICVGRRILFPARAAKLGNILPQKGSPINSHAGC